MGWNWKMLLKAIWYIGQYVYMLLGGHISDPVSSHTIVTWFLKSKIEKEDRTSDISNVHKKTVARIYFILELIVVW